ncbi:MAG: hypothetical protein P8Z36_02870 [Gemmatimonadota bacterium]
MRVFILVLLLLASSGRSLLAQIPEKPATSAVPDIVDSRDHHSVAHVVLWAVGGAIVGGWTGYVASQVARSDWSDASGRGALRLRFSLAGAGLGLLGGFLAGNRAPARPVTPVWRPTDVRNGPITEEDIRASMARSVTELLREKRPQWLRARGVDVLQSPSDSLSNARGRRVYLNGQLLGGLGALDDVSIDVVTRIEFFDAGAAVVRWGAGNEDGAILLKTVAGSP